MKLAFSPPSKRAAVARLFTLAGGLLLAACSQLPLPPAQQSQVWLLGEVHDNPEGHRQRFAWLQQQVMQGWRPAIALEQFDREQQPLLDMAQRDCPDAACLLGRVAGEQQWQWSFYAPVIDLALQQRLPLLAANLSRADAGKVMRQGYGAALKLGIRHAQYDWILITDADGTYPVAAIPEILARAEANDMVVGARVGAEVSIPWERRPAKWFLNHLANYMVSARIPDLNSGLRVFQRPDRFKSLVDYDPGAEARLARGHDVWRNEPGGPLEPARGPMWAAVMLQAMRADLPWLLAEHEEDLTIDGDEPPPAGLMPDAEAKRKRLAITIPIETGLVFRAWLDADGLVVVSQGLLDHGGMRTHFETVYSDYRDVDGVMFAHHEDNWASGMRTGVTTVKKVVVNPKLRDDEFTPPGDGHDD